MLEISPLARNQFRISGSWARSMLTTFFIGSSRLRMGSEAAIVEKGAGPEQGFVFPEDGYVLHSGRPYSLWFCFLGGPTGLLNDFVVRRGRDSHGLLRQAEE